MKEVKNLSASIYARLQNIAREQKMPFQEVLQYYGMERFLFRLMQTNAANEFVLKGGLIFYALGFSLRRTTRDIDFRSYSKNSMDYLTEIIQSACSATVDVDDGIIFESNSIHFEEIMADAMYPGIRISLNGFLGKAKIPIRIDIGFSDPITLETQIIHYPVLLENMKAPVIKGYPLETIIAEKFQAIIHLEEINSRWKDFYDIWILSEFNTFNGESLRKAILATFQRRETDLPQATPKVLSDDYATAHQTQWESFLSRNILKNEYSGNFMVIVSRLRSFLLPPVLSTDKSNEFLKTWSATSGWK